MIRAIYDLLTGAATPTTDYSSLAPSTPVPKGTPVFGVCYVCKDKLIYPAILVAAWTQPDSTPLGYVSEWRRYCLKCAIPVIQHTKPEDIIPEQCWGLDNVGLVPNPIRRIK